MANIYEEKNEPLHELLNRARSDDGATVLIPDLQRPYVWTPNQVTLLIDSLIRGWPFGTLLMWRAESGDLARIPHRAFWRLVDRTVDADQETVAAMNPPASFHMVLDGQQRVQSLLLALGGDSWGFKLEDRSWADELHDRRIRGRPGRYLHWSKACLCFDVPAFRQAYEEAECLQGIDFRTVLRWVVTDVNGQSYWPKPNSYIEPLERADDPRNAGSFVRLSRLWAAVGTNPQLKESHFQAATKTLFDEHAVPAGLIAELQKPMGELMSTLRDVKLSKITYLELQAYDPLVWDDESYNDAIVNIFTRLNTAGRTLTRQEITLAWLKVGWRPEHTEDKPAAKCFAELGEAFRERGMPLDTDDLVAAASFTWSVICNEGALLANKDLLKGAAIQPMAAALSERWRFMTDTMIATLDRVGDRGLQYGATGQYDSLYSIAVLWSWVYLGLEWLPKQAMTFLQRDSFQKKLWDQFDEIVDRWLICSSWADRWSGKPAESAQKYAKMLNDAARSIGTATTPEQVLTALSDGAAALMKDIEEDAVAGVSSTSARSRSSVSTYRDLLWVWHRLDGKRWAMSQIALRTGKSSSTNLEVDHMVAASFIKKQAESDAAGDAIKLQELQQPMNFIGNCSLLEKSFNISKSDKELAEFLGDVHEFKEGEVSLDAWAEAMAITDTMLRPKLATLAQIRTAIEERERLVQSELTEFVRGTRRRVDLAT